MHGIAAFGRAKRKCAGTRRRRSRRSIPVPCSNNLICRVSSSVERSLPKPQRRVRFPYPAPSSRTKKDIYAKNPEVSTTSGFFCAQFLKSEKKISKSVLAKSVDLYLYPRDFWPLFRKFFEKAALFRSRQNVEFKQVVLLVLLNRHSECMRHDVGTGKARNIQEDSI